MLKLVILVGLGVAGYIFVKRFLAEESAGFDSENYHSAPQDPQPAQQ